MSKPFLTFSSPVSFVLERLKQARVQRDCLVWAGGAIAALLVCGLALSIPLPTWFLQLLPTSRAYVPLFFFGALWLSFRQRHRLEPAISLVFVSLLFTMPLVLLWNTGRSSLGAIGGLLPWTDTGIYFRLAYGILDGADVGLAYARPFFPGLLTVIFGLTQRSLLQTQVIVTGIAAISIYLATRELRRTFGATLAAFCTVGVYVYYAPYVGSLMTENLGIALGVLSLAVLWRGARLEHKRTVIVGIFLLTLALCSRMGALLILPLLLLWGAFGMGLPQRRQSRTSHYHFSIAFAVQAAAAILLGFLLNSLLTRVLSSQEHISFGNYSFVLYGLLKGGNWQSIFQDYPDTVVGTATERARIAYQICWEFIRQHPFSLLWGSLRAVVTLPWRGSQLLVPAAVTQPLYAILVNAIARPTLLLGLIACARFWRYPLAGLMLVVLLGTLVSAPLAPVWDAGLRPYAATIMAYYALMALGMGVAWQWFRHRNSDSMRGWAAIEPLFQSVPRRDAAEIQSLNFLDRVGLSKSAIMALALTLVFVLGPIGIKAIATPSPRLAACPTGTEARLIHIHPQSVLHLITEEEAAHTYLPEILISDFRRGLSRLQLFPGLIQALGDLKPHNTLLQSTSAGLTVMPTELVPKQIGYYTACGTFQSFKSNQLTESRFFQVSSLTYTPKGLSSPRRKQNELKVNQ